MSFGDKALKHHLCVELGKSPIETKHRKIHLSGSSVFRALVYRWYRWFSDDSSAPLC